MDDYSKECGLATEDEIRSRVEAADLARTRTRASVAAKIAADIERRNKVRAELAEIDATIAAGIADVVSVLTLTELSKFTGIAETELIPAQGSSRSVSRGGSRDERWSRLARVAPRRCGQRLVRPRLQQLITEATRGTDER